jgi:glycine/D-amino acid oxidase-like deaminating enzyme
MSNDATTATPPPHVVVIGGGVVGVFSALALSRQGARVTLLERHSQVAMETSFGNAGRVCPTRLATYPPVGTAALAKLAHLPGVASKALGGGAKGATGGDTNTPGLCSCAIGWLEVVLCRGV